MIAKLKFLFKYTHRYKWWYSGGILFMGLTLWISVTIPDYLQKSIDLITSDFVDHKDEFYTYVLIILGLAVALIIVRSLSRILFFLPARLIEKQLKSEMFRKLTGFEKEYFDNNETGSTISRVNNDTNGVRMITGFGIMQCVNIVFSLSMTPYKMWVMSWQLTIYCILPLICIFIIIRFGMVAMVKNTQLRMSDLQNLSGKAVTFLSGSSIIKSYNMHRWAEEKILEQNSSLLDHTLKIAKLRSFIMPLLGNLEQILKIVVMLVGGIYVINQKFTIGELTAFISYATLLTMPIMGLGWVLTIFQQGFVGIDSIQTILNRKGIDDDKKELQTTEKSNLLSKGIRVSELSFKYSDGETEVLKNISFDIKPGQVIGITGPVGSGKTTLVNCLNQYLKPGAGQIFFSNIDAALLKGHEIRSVVRTVCQDVFLFSDSVENNIVFGSQNASVTNGVETVIYQSSLSDDVSRFPDKEKTMVGEKGIMLSGGQKQRISLARALYTPCELLILDDVFSAVDGETERFLVKEIFNNQSAGSLLIISNRVSVLEKADIIIVIINGQIAESGTHEELLKTSDFYKSTCELQEN